MHRRAFLPALASPLLAQETDVIRVTTEEVVAPVTVVDKRTHRFVNGLEAKDFALIDNGKPQDIKVDVTWIPISLVVAVQANNVVEPFLGKIKKIGPLLEGLVLGEQGEGAILKFDHRMSWMTDGFINDGREFTKALDRINPGSSTSALVDAVFEATRRLRSRPKDRRRILLLISETRDKGSEGRLREALLGAQVNNIIVYSVNINRAVTMLAKKMDAPPLDPRPPAARGPMPGGGASTPGMVAASTGYGGASFNVTPLIKEVLTQVKAVFVPNPLEVFTRHTGGREFDFLTQKDLEETVSRLGEELHSQYLITYRPNNRSEAGWHDIKVTVGEGRRNSTEVRTRPGYWTAAKFDN